MKYKVDEKEDRLSPNKKKKKNKAFVDPRYFCILRKD